MDTSVNSRSTELCLKEEKKWLIQCGICLIGGNHFGYTKHFLQNFGKPVN